MSFFAEKLLFLSTVKHTHGFGRLLVKCYASSQNAFQDVKLVLDTVEKLSLIPLKLKRCTFGKSFSSSHIQYEEFYTSHTTGKEMVPELPFQALFKNGFEHLFRVIKGDFEIPMTKETVRFINAVQPLQSFLENIDTHEHALKRKESKGIDLLTDPYESAVAALLTHHLLSPLVPGDKYVISNDYADKVTYCPCWDVDCKRKIHYGRTSIGSTKMWYGIPDVIVLPDSVVMVEPASKKSNKKCKMKDEEKMSEMSEVQKHRRSLNSEQVTSEIISQAITFSLYISKLKVTKPDLITSDITLTPTMVINPTSVRVFMYDHRYDVLLCNDDQTLQLWDKSGYHFKKSTILYIWMILNHMICMPQLQPFHIEFLQNSSNFNRLCESYGLQAAEISSDIHFGNSFWKEKNDKKRERYVLVSPE